jgi:hypothetical protein
VLVPRHSNIPDKISTMPLNARQLAWFAALISGLLAPPAARAQEHPALSGGWVLAQEVEGSRDIRPRPGGGQGPTGMRGAFGGDPGLAELLRPKQRLLIADQDSLVGVTDDAGWARLLIVSGAAMREDLGQGGPAEVVSRWKDNRLLTERRLDRGGVYSEVYELDAKTGRLLVRVSFKTERMERALELRRVYQPDSAAAPFFR